MDTEKRYRHRVWRSLDANPAFFGIRGRYLLLLAAAVTGGLMLCIPAFLVCGRFVSMALTAAVIVSGYLVTLRIQSRMSARQFSRMATRMKLVRFVRVRPGSVSSNLEEDIRWK